MTTYRLTMTRDRALALMRGWATIGLAEEIIRGAHE